MDVYGQGNHESDEPRIAFLEVDSRTSMLTFRLADGRAFQAPLPTPLPPTSAITRMTCDPISASFTMETAAGERVVAELPPLTASRLADPRPVIYLDQNHWSTLANAIHDPTRGHKQEIDAALRLIELANDLRIRLPISAAHISETVKWTRSDRRYHLALTMLQLSRGWQMRDPLDIRRIEIRHAFVSRFPRDDEPISPAIFTLEPEVLFGEHRSTRMHLSANENSLGLPLRALVSVSSIFDLMLDTEPVELGDVTGWVKKVQTWSNWLANEPRDRELRRLRTNAFFVYDLMQEFSDEFQRTPLLPEVLERWVVAESDSDINAMPSLGLYREVFREKLLNPDTRWETNDLFDLVYLTCAAGYADYIVGENRLAADMEQGARRLGRTSIQIHRRLRSVVDALGG